MFYAVKANPAPEVLKLLASLGSSFDTASVAEIEMVLAAGAKPDRISFGNTIKKERDVARAYALGVRLFAVDRVAEVEKIARAAPGSLSCSAGSCTTAPAPNGRSHANSAATPSWRSTCSSTPTGCSAWWRTVCRSMSASQQPRTQAWDGALKAAAAIFRGCAERGISLAMVNLGGGFPARYLKERAGEGLWRSIFRALRKHFGNRIPDTIIEPGRGMVGDAGIIEAEVVLVSKKSESDAVRWVYLDIGKFGGLAETMDESIRYRSARRGTATSWRPALAGRPATRRRAVRAEPYALPISLAIGDRVLIEGTGAYTATYSSVAFNGFAPLKTYHTGPPPGPGTSDGHHPPGTAG